MVDDSDLDQGKQPVTLPIWRGKKRVVLDVRRNVMENPARTTHFWPTI